MAAGGVDVSRRSGGYVGHAKRDSDYYRNGAHDSRPSRGGRHQNGYRASTYEHGRENGRRVSERRDFVPRREEQKDGGVVSLPPAKKRKFSPIIWDVEDKVAKVPFENKFEAVSSTPYLSSPVGDVSSGITYGDVTTDPSSDNWVGVKESSKPVSPGLAPYTVPTFTKQDEDDDREEGEMEEEDVVQAPNIATSRWASDYDSPKELPLPDGEDTPKTERRNSKSSTPECGGFSVDSEGNRSRSSGSGRGGHSVGPADSHEQSDNELQSGNAMDVDEAESDSSDVNQLEDEERAQGGMNMMLGSRSVDEYEKLNKINEGTYGVVYRARDKKTGEIVALKKVKMNLGREDEYGFPVTSLREINILLGCNHPSIVNVKEVVVGNSDSVFMVMEHLEHDLKGIMERMKQPFSTSEVKCLMLQLLEGVKYLHDNWIIHRDLKPSNLLINNEGEMKICDFGMSRQFGSPLKPYTQLVVTQWYRAPELLLGAKKYSTAIDMWSVGCIMAEMLSRKPLFQGKGGSDIDQLHKIFGILGTPNETIWPGLSVLPGAKANFVKQPYNLLRKKFPAASFTGSPVLSDLGFDLLNKLLTYDPEKRITADAALNHDWFHEVPLPKSKEFMPTFPPRRG